MTEPPPPPVLVRARRRLRRWWDDAVLRRGTMLAAALTACLVAAVVHPSAYAPMSPQPPSEQYTHRTVPLELGVTVFSMWRDWDQHELWFQRAKDTGSGWLRVDMGWCSLEEAGPGRVSDAYQARLDATADAARQLGMRLLVQIGCTPKWAGGSDAKPYPDDADQFERITRYLAERYRGRVAAWEIWTEPNCIGGCSNGSPDQFVTVLQAGYRGIKAGDQDAVVVAGGVSGTDVGWLRRMYAAGAQGWFDALAVHPFQDPPTAPPDAPPGSTAAGISTLPGVHELMTANGDGKKPIWLTEWGWTTARLGPRPGVSDNTQAQYLRDAVRQIDTEYPYVTNAFWCCLRDRDDSTPYENNFGLLHLHGSPKPAFAALQKANADIPTDR